jgi:hypothetical protein
MPANNTQSTGPKAQPWKDVINATKPRGDECVTISGPVADREESGTLSGQKIDLASNVAQREESGTLSG